MTEQEIRNSLDTAIKILLSDIEASVPVKFTKWNNDHFACQVHKNANGEQCEAEILYKEPLEQAKLAHELLHVKTSIILGDNSIMFSVENPCQLFTNFLSLENASNIVNVCEHVIFFPDYLDMGYEEEDSFEKPTDLDKSLKELIFLESHGLKEDGHYSSDKLFLYLSLVFSFLFYPNENRFKREVKRLRKINLPLFTIIKNLKAACSDLEVIPENRDYIQEAYREFAEKMNEWMTKAFEGAVFVPQHQQ